MPVFLAAAETIVLAPSEPDRVVIDLTVPTPCAEDEGEGSEDEIVVCAKLDGESPYRFAGLQRSGTATLPRAEVSLADGSILSAETESADLGMVRSQRLMVRWKIKF